MRRGKDQGGAVLQAEHPSWIRSCPCSRYMSHVLDVQWSQDKMGWNAGMTDPRRNMWCISAARVISSATTVTGEEGAGPWETDGLEESRDDALISVPLLLPGNAHPADKLSVCPTLQGESDRNIRWRMLRAGILSAEPQIFCTHSTVIAITFLFRFI